MSKLFVDEIVHQSSQGSGTITLGASGETISVPSGATLTVPNGGLSGQNYPAFEAYLSANQSISDSTATKVQFNTERFDTDSCYDNATNYRFTPTVAGKYFVYANVVFQLDDYQIYQGVIYFYKNGSNYHSFGTVDGAGSAFGFPISTSAIIDMNGTTDYIEVFGQIIRHSSTGNRFGTEYRGTYFGAYRIGN
jgi:hypothetical protein